MSGSFIVKALRGALALILLLVAWSAALWWLIAPDFASLRLPDVAALHVGPPLLFCGGWRFWLGQRRQRRAATAEMQERRAEQDRKDALEAAMRVHVTEQQRRRYGCDCRAVAVVQLSRTGGAIGETVPESEAITFSMRTADESVVETQLIEHLRPGIEEALDSLYNRCPAALVFPVYVTAPSDVLGEDVMALVRQVRTQFIANGGDVFRRGVVPSEASDAVIFMPESHSAADSAISLFEDNPEQPGAVLLAFDSPSWRECHGARADDGGGDAVSEEGLPAQGVFALVITHPQLPEMLSGVQNRQMSHGVMTPYWEKSVGQICTSICLVSLSDLALDTLCCSRPVARIHRAAPATTVPGKAGRLKLAQCCETLIESAQINSGQIDLAFGSSPELEAESSRLPQKNTGCGWLVHNAGVASQGGYRLASLGVALFRRGIDIDPIDAATNVCATVGDLGRARQVAMLTLAVAHAAAGQCGALCADFGDDDRLTVFFAMAAKEPM